jgi:pyridoxine 5-phosphate synthase
VELVEGAAQTGTERVELYTEPYATNFPTDKAQAIAPFIKAAEVANACQLGLNAGHDLNLENLKYFKDNIPGLLEVSIGHALISDALYLGLEKTIHLYLQQLK